MNRADVRPQLAYERDPAAIYRRSFATIRAEADLSALPDDIATIAVRLIHACGMTDIAADLAFSFDVAQATRSALAAGAPIWVDSRMVAAGIIRDRLPRTNEVHVSIDEAGVAERAAHERTTRSAAAIAHAGSRLNGAVIAIGNAPTALFRLLELIADAAVRPAAILAFPVGFIGAAESKAALIASAIGVPYVTLRGRRGGSALAAAAINACAGGEP